MDEVKQLKNEAWQAAEGCRDEIISLGREVYANPETGFKEEKTSRLLESKFRQLGFECIKPDNITGFKAVMDTGKEGPSIAILAELDSIICAEHPDSDRQTGAVHACAHNIQVAAVYGAALALLKSRAAEGLSGRINFIFVPAEEGIEMDYRNRLREKGVIEHLSGKPEFMRRGFFDDINLSFMLHGYPGEKKIYYSRSSNGNLIKDIKYSGKAAHAGASPDKGINALYAANLGLSAVNAVRETFRDDDHIRVHAMITKGGEAVNVIPSDVRLSMYVRGKTPESIMAANRKVDMALAGGAISMGAKVEITDMPGYMPMVSDEGLMSVADNVAKELVSEADIEDLGHLSLSTDMGDVSTVMPAIHLYVGGVKGSLHGRDFRIDDEDTAYVMSAKLLAAMSIELLANNGEKASGIIRSHKPYFQSIQDYLKYTSMIHQKKVLPKCDCWI